MVLGRNMIKTIGICVILLSILFIFFVGNSSADLYSWVDEKGVTHVSDIPPKNDTDLKVEAYKTNKSTDDNPSDIFGKVMSTYKSMQTYKAQGTVVSDIDTGAIKMNIQTSFSIILEKPNLYLISWTQENMPMPGMTQSGAVWSDGTQPYLYMGVLKAYSKMSSDEIALSSATGISSGAAFTIPSLFLSVFKGQVDPFSRLKDPVIEKTEKVGEEDCYVISGASTISKKETFWISKSKYLIIKCSRSFEPPAEMMATPEMTDTQLEETLKDMGQEATEENKQKMREMTNKTREVLKTMKGSLTETHMEISSPEISKKDFQFALPEGTVLKESLF